MITVGQQPHFYELERGYWPEKCEETVFESSDGTSVRRIAVDDRYLDQGKVAELPNESTL